MKKSKKRNNFARSKNANILKTIPFFVQFSLLSGLSAGILLGIIGGLLAFFGLNPVGQYELIFLNPVLLIFLFLGMRTFRFRFGGGFLEGWKAVSIGILTVFAASFVYALANWLIFNFSDTALLLYKEQIAVLLKNLKEEQSTAQTENLEQDVKNISAFGIAFQVYIRTFALGMFFAFVSTIFVKKSKPVPSA